MRHLVVALALLLAMLAVPASAASPVFVVTGRGWGHGIGMSQYGAHGYARQGWTHRAILAHYYTGAVLSSASTSDLVQVLLASGQPSVSFSSAAPFSIAGRMLGAGTYAVAPSPGQIRLTDEGTSVALGSPATVTPGAAALQLGPVAYRGAIVLASSPTGSEVSALNTLGREEYLRGVVPREMPASWEPEALRAQAIAARTYSLAVAGHCVWPPGPLRSAYCPDTRDQVYGGLSAEAATASAAVESTAGEIVTYASRPARTYFFSASGGRTAAIAEEWGGPAVPYLVSVSDPYDTLSPHHAWGGDDAETDCPGTSPDCLFTAGRVQALLGLAGPPLDLRVSARNGSGRVASLEAAGATTKVDFTGTAARSKLGLRSTWFSVGVLSLAPSATRITYGQPVTLFGLTRRGQTRGWGVARLEQRRAGVTAWTTINARLAVGRWTVQRRPSRTVEYRLVSGNATGQAQRVAVRTSVTLRRSLRGSVRPARRGIPVTLSRRRAYGRWTLWARTSTSSRGGFTFKATRPGTYRARADAGAGLAPGYATITLPG